MPKTKTAQQLSAMPFFYTLAIPLTTAL